MRKITLLVITAFLIIILPPFALAAENNHTASEEAEGKVVWEKLQAKEITCGKLSNENFERLGEYFMGQMAGSSHEAMNNMMTQMMGQKGEEQMHVVMGKRLSDCDSLQARGGGNSMMGWWGSNGMMNWGGVGLLFSLFWIVILVDLILLGFWLWKQIQKK